MQSIRRSAKSAGIAVALGLGLCASGARAGDDTGPFAAIAGAIGFDTNKSGEQIDYRERPRLVVPPNRDVLPEPRAGEARPASFPVDQGGVRRQGARPYAGNGSANANEPARQNLTQPPGGYRQATKDLSKLQDPDKKGTSWWNPLGAGSPLASIGKNIGLGE